MFVLSFFLSSLDSANGAYINTIITQNWDIKKYWKRLIQYRVESNTNSGGRHSRMPIPHHVQDCSKQIHLIQLGEYTVFNTLRLLEEWADDLDQKQPPEARNAIPWPAGHPSLQLALKEVQANDALSDEDKEWRSLELVQQCLESLTGPNNKVLLFKQLHDMFHGELDGSLKMEVNDSALHSRDKGKVAELANVNIPAFSFAPPTLNFI